MAKSNVHFSPCRYGDRVPKSLLARLFGILWILSGLLLCSFYTATFTSALTSSSLSHRSSLLGVKVGITAFTLPSLKTVAIPFSLQILILPHDHGSHSAS